MPRIAAKTTRKKKKELKAMMKAGGCAKMEELFDNAITLARWAMRKVQAGAAFGALDEENMSFLEVGIPILENVRNSKIKF